MREKQKDLIVENARLMFRNFAGRQTKYNAAGDRSFCLVLDEPLAMALKEAGWNVKSRDPQDPEDSKLYYTRIKVVYKNFPPKIFMITGDKSILLDEDSVKELDFAEIDNVDVIVNPHFWSMNGQTGHNGYVKKMYVTLAPEDFGGKYRDMSMGPVVDPEEDNEVPF